MRTPPDTLPLLPCNEEAEQAVLGAILFSNDAFWKVAGTLEPADFSQPRHAVIFATMRRLLNQQTPVDLISLYEAGLERHASVSYLTDLAQAVATSASITYHAKLVKQAAHRRKVWQIAQQVAEAALRSEEDTATVLESSLQTLASCLSVEGKAMPLKEAVESAMESIQRLALTPDRLIGLPTGFSALDRVTGGFQPGQAIVMAGVTKVGKSSLLLHSLLAAARAGHPVALVSLEMGQTQVALRALAAESGVAHYRLRRGLVSTGEAWSQTVGAANRLGVLPFYLVELMDTSMLAILEMGRKLVYQHGIELLAIDYMGLVQGGQEYKTASENSRLCKVGARQLNLPIVALHQLKREVSERPDKHPQLTDLKQTGQIENDADLVLFLYREGYYQDTGLTEEPAELRIAAQRDGPTGDIPLTWHPETMAFTEPHAEAAL